MGALFSQLGIDWRLLISQAVNFLILLTVLRLFVYGPLMKVLEERRNRIALGIEKAKEADTRLSEANEIAKGRLKEADAKAESLLAEVKTRKLHEEEKLRQSLSEKEQEGMVALVEEFSRKKAAAQKELELEEGEIIKTALIKTVGLAPEAIDEALIAQALREVRR
jgi:F-type H+-transporting ATPase subunit b